MRAYKQATKAKTATANVAERTFMGNNNRQSYGDSSSSVRTAAKHHILQHHLPLDAASVAVSFRLGSLHFVVC